VSEVGLAMAFLGGLLALLSPCSALLLPAFFAYSFTSRTRLVARTGLFYVGLCTTLVPLGAAGSFASRLFYGHRDVLVTVGGWTVIALGVAQVVGLGFGSRRMAQAAGARRSGSAVSVFALGAVYGLAGFCAGPILGGISRWRQWTVTGSTVVCCSRCTPWEWRCRCSRRPSCGTGLTSDANGG
jgi:cytochrome c biogenesis protein CcdA